jgi:phosphocarrier protein
MVERTVVLTNETGLHARPANEFTKEANKYRSKITIQKNGEQFNAKSIISILSMGADKGTQISIIAEGEDEDQAVEALAKLVNSSFGE